jgi:phosphate transport system permease protein
VILYLLLLLCIGNIISYYLIIAKANRLEKTININKICLPKYYSYVILTISFIVNLFFNGLIAKLLQINPFYSFVAGVFVVNSLLYLKINYISNPIKVLESIWKALTGVISIVLILASLALITILLTKTISFFRIVDLKEIIAINWNPQLGKFGVLPVLYGSFIICLLAIVIALPLALLASTFVEEYMPSPYAKVANSLMNILVAVPSIVYGSFAALYCGPQIKKTCNKIGLEASTESALAASITISFMIVPFITSFISRAIKALPKNLKEASYALGATKSETIIWIIWPSILPSIVSGTMIAMSRAFGETMVVTMASGLSAQITLNPLESVTTVTAQVVTLFTGDQRTESVETLSGFVLGLLLVIISAIFNMFSLNYINKKSYA